MNASVPARKKLPDDPPRIIRRTALFPSTVARLVVLGLGAATLPAGAADERIQSRQISGTLKRFEGQTQITATPQGTRVAYRGTSTGNQSIPPIVGPSFIKSETEEQFHELQTDILRRRAEAGRRNK